MHTVSIQNSNNLVKRDQINEQSKTNGSVLFPKNNMAQMSYMFKMIPF